MTDFADRLASMLAAEAAAATLHEAAAKLQEMK